VGAIEKIYKNYLTINRPILVPRGEES